MAERYEIKDYGRYFKLEYENNHNLFPGDKISDFSMMVGIVSNGKLNPNKLALRQRDAVPIRIGNSDGDLMYEINLPGKSGLILFNDDINRKIVGEAVEKSLSRPLNRRDKLHTSTVGLIESAGWQVYWAPLPNGNILHARIVPESSLLGKTFTSREAEALCSVFSKSC